MKSSKTCQAKTRNILPEQYFTRGAAGIGLRSAILTDTVHFSTPRTGGTTPDSRCVRSRRRERPRYFAAGTYTHGVPTPTTDLLLSLVRERSNIVVINIIVIVRGRGPRRSSLRRRRRSRCRVRFVLLAAQERTRVRRRPRHLSLEDEK